MFCLCGSILNLDNRSLSLILVLSKVDYQCSKVVKTKETSEVLLLKECLIVCIFCMFDNWNISEIC